MNNLPLQPLKWSRTHSTRSALHIYFVRNDSESDGKYEVRYREIFGQPKPPATGFATIDEAKAWAWNHYNEKMQPYVKPMPTWVDASERLPEEDGLYLAHYPDQPYAQQIVWFSSNINKFNLFHDLVTHWQPLPKPPSEVTK